MEKGESSVSLEDLNEQKAVPAKSRHAKGKKFEFVGWASKSLVIFLESIGKCSSQPIPQGELTNLVNNYVRGNKLIHPQKRKRFVCDERLYSLFGKSTVAQNRISELLKQHCAENYDSSEDEPFDFSEEEGDVIVASKKQKVSSIVKRVTSKKRQVSGKSCYPAIITENMNLLYLKRTLIEDLLKDPESFESKLIGSYVRIKSDPNDYSQKNSHQLLPVTGVRRVEESGDSCVVLFQVPCMISDVPMGRLSDADFTESECEELLERFKDGMLTRPNVVEFEEKARQLRKDIMKHWLPREIDHLQNLIDRANEKGWRSELYEHLQTRQLLKSPSEQSRLCSEVPNLILEELEPKALPQDAIISIEPGETLSLISTCRHDPDSCVDSGADLTLPSSCSDVPGHRDGGVPCQVSLTDLPVVEAGETGFNEGTTTVNESDGAANISAQGVLTGLPVIEDGKTSSTGAITTTYALDNAVQPPATNLPWNLRGGLVIDGNGGPICFAHSGEPVHLTPPPANPFKDQVWFFSGPYGDAHGPVSIEDLVTWWDVDYYPPDFSVWRLGHSPDEAVWLTELIRRTSCY